MSDEILAMAMPLPNALHSDLTGIFFLSDIIFSILCIKVVLWVLGNRGFVNGDARTLSGGLVGNKCKITKHTFSPKKVKF